MEAAIHKKDFQTFAKLTMQDSNQFHAICLDTYPPITYMNSTSQRIISLITKYNGLQDELKVVESNCVISECIIREYSRVEIRVNNWSAAH